MYSHSLSDLNYLLHNHMCKEKSKRGSSQSTLEYSLYLTNTFLQIYKILFTPKVFKKKYLLFLALGIALILDVTMLGLVVWCLFVSSNVIEIQFLGVVYIKTWTLSVYCLKLLFYFTSTETISNVDSAIYHDFRDSNIVNPLVGHKASC